MNRQTYPAAALPVAPLAAKAGTPPANLAALLQASQEVCASGVPHSGAGDRYTVVAKRPLDALKRALEGHPPMAVPDSPSRPETPIKAIYERWRQSLNEFTALDTQWRAGHLTDAKFDELCEPIFTERDRIEAEMFEAPCSCIADLNMLVLVAAYYDWLVEPFNDGVQYTSVRLASNWPVDE